MKRNEPAGKGGTGPAYREDWKHKEEKMKKGKRILALCLSAAMLFSSIPAGMATAVAREKEIVAGGYEIDMDDLPKVYFAEHPEWEELYEAAWESHKSNIRKANTILNPEDVYYVDEAFSDMIFAWDTLFMMMFDKYGMHQFPVQQALDNFYYFQVDNPGQPDDGFIAREISEKTGVHASYNGEYDNPLSVNPPLWAWAEWQQYQIHGDKARFSKVIDGKTVLERIVSHFDFIKRTRTMEENGLYGKTSGLANGLDNTPNQDHSRKEQTYNDLSIQQAQSAYYIAKIAHEIGDTATEERFHKEYEEISALINELLWSEEGQFYFNLDKDQQFTNVPTPTGLWALAGHVATPERADAMVKNYGLNSEKMYRPQGLSTVTYDWPSFKTTGGYWNGAIWAPTSFQYIKGLEYYGYDDLAFSEALRHVEALSDVYEAGKTDSVVGSATLWENYASEYARQGDPARGNFVGWTGALGIGSIIEDLLGVELRAPLNEIDWDLRLTEACGVTNLYMCHEGQPVRASLEMAARSGSDSPADITVTANVPFTLYVTNGGVEQTIEVPAGRSTYHIDGVEEADAYLGAAARPLQSDDASLTREAVDANAADYITFTDAADDSIDDGLLYQAGKRAGAITNVNTIGYRYNSTQSPVKLSDSAELAALGFEGAKSLTKKAFTDGEEGFMLNVPADNSFSTVKLIVGVQNTTATVTAALSDASAPRAIRQITGGAAEQTYVIEIPYRAGGDGQSLLVEYTAMRGTEGSVSLKGIFYEKSGAALPQALENPSLASGDGQLVLSADAAEDASYDSYQVYIGEKAGELTEVRSVSALPYTIASLDNYKRYYVAVSGVKDGVEGPLSEIVSNVPEKTPRTERERAYADYESVKAMILNGNADFDNVTRSLNFNVTGPVYGTAFAFSSTANGYPTGLMNDGSVVTPTLPEPDRSCELTVSATCGSETITLVENVVVKSQAYDRQPYVFGTMVSAMNTTADLTAEGTRDWAQFCTHYVDDYAKKDTENTITGLRRLAEGGVDHATDMPFRYSATDAKDKAPVDRTCITSRGPEGEAGFTFQLPYSEKMQHVNIYASSWNATTRVDFLVNGAVLYSTTYGGSNGWDVQKIGVDYKVPNPDDVVTVRQILVKSNTGGSGGSIGLPAVTLAETDGVIPEPDNTVYASGVISDANNATVDLTAEGTRDWAQFPTKLVGDYAKKNVEASSITNLHRLVSDDTPLAVDVAKDMKISFNASDAAEGTQPKNQWAITCRGPEELAGFAFNLPTSDKMQNVNVYLGSWNGTCKVELRIGGKVRYAGEYGGSNWSVQKCSIDYYTDHPDDEVEFRMVMNKSHSTSPGGSIALAAVTLRETDAEVPEKDPPFDESFNITMTNTLPDQIDLTAEGGKDWMLFNSVDGNAAYERKNVEPQIRGFAITNPDKAPHRVKNSEYNTVYSFTDGTPTASMENQKPYVVVETVGNGVDFTLPGGPNRQQAKITFGDWNSQMVVEMTSGGKTASYTYQVGQPVKYGMYTLTYQSDEDVHVRIYNKAITHSAGNFSITAILLNELYSVEAAPAAGGRVRVGRASVAAGETVDVFALPEEGMRLASLSYQVDGGAPVAITGGSFVMPEGNVTVTAVFEKIALTTNLLIASYGAGADLTVAGGGDDVVIERGGLYAARIEEGSKLAFRFTPADENDRFLAAEVNGEPVENVSADSAVYEYTMPGEAAQLAFKFTIVKTSILRMVIDTAKELIEGDEYASAVEPVRQNITKKLAAAEKVLADVSATQAQVDKAWKDLMLSLHYLSFEAGSKTELGKLIAIAQDVNTADFTPETVAVFEKALAEAEEVYNDPDNMLKAEIDKAWKNLYDAMCEMGYLADRSGLEGVLEQANQTMAEIGLYVDGSEAVLTAAIEAAQTVYDDASATQKQIDAAANKLANVLAGLRKIPDKDALRELIEKYLDVKPEGYTPSSFASLRAALAAANAVYMKEDASPAEISGAYDTLDQAGNALENNRHNTPSGGSSGNKRPSGNVSGTGTAVAVTSPVVAAAQGVAAQQSVRSDTTMDFTLKRGNAYCFKMTVVGGGSAAPNFTVGNGSVLKTQFVAKIGSDCYYRVWAIGAPGQSTGVYTAMSGENPQKHCTVTIG